MTLARSIAFGMLRQGTMLGTIAVAVFLLIRVVPGEVVDTYTRALLASRPAPRLAPCRARLLSRRHSACATSCHLPGAWPLRRIFQGARRRDPRPRTRRGKAIGLVGESGSGKSTLARAVFGLVAPSAGTLRVFGRNPLSATDRQGAARAAQMVFQDAAGSLDPRLRVRELLGEPLAIRGLCPGTGREARAATLLEGAASRRRISTATLTSSRAASASAWRSPGRYRSIPGCWSATNLFPPST